MSNTDGIMRTDFEREKREKREAIYNEYMAELNKGSQPSAICEVLAKKYGYRQHNSIWNVLRRYMVDHPEAPMPYAARKPKPAVAVVQ